MMEFWLSRSCSHELFLFHDGILAIKEPFTRTFSLSRWNSDYQGAFSHELFFFSLPWNSGYQGAFHTNFYFFYDGTLAIKEPFTRNFFFTMEFWLSRSRSHELFSFTMEFSKYAIWGKTLFIYITKSIYIGSASLKTLPLDLEPPLQGKEYDPPYSKANTKKESYCFFPKSLIDT
jgi:hypothetical protein